MTAAPRRARAFWAAREQQAKGEARGGQLSQCDLALASPRQRPSPWDAHAWAGLYCTLRDKRRVRARASSAAAGAASASAAAGGGGGAAPPPPPPPPRSLTPSSLTSSSGRTTPTPTASLSLSASLSPSHGSLFRMTSRSLSEEVLSGCSASSSVSRSSSHRFRTCCWLEPRPVPVRYSSTVFMKVGSTKKRFVEEVTFQTRLVPRRFSETMTTATTIPSRRFTSVLEIECLTPAVRVFSLDQDEPLMNGTNGVNSS